MQMIIKLFFSSSFFSFSLSVSISILFGKLFFLLFSLHRGIGVAHSQRSDHYLQNNNDSAIADVYAIYLYVDGLFRKKFLWIFFSLRIIM